MRYFASIFLSILCCVSYSQVLTQTFTKGEAQMKGFKVSKKVLSKKVMDMPKVDVARLMKEDKEMTGEDVPFRFGYGFDTSYTLEDGEWEEIEGGRLWSITFKSSNAYSLNFVFDNFSLPKGAHLNISNHDETVIYGPVTSNNIPKDGFFLTDLIPDSIATIYLFEPTDQIGKSTLRIKKIVHGYHNMFTTNDSYGNPGGSANCNVPVENKFPEYEKEANAIALILLADGTSLCSGSLVISTDMSFKPYLLTAFHCINTELEGNPPEPTDMTISSSEEYNVNHWAIKFGFRQYSSNAITFNGANLRAGWFDSDFALVELYEDVKQFAHLTWLGWDKSSTTPSSGVGIHHPQGDYMKISIDEDASQSSSFPSLSFPNNTTHHWLEHWEEGIVQEGSSGSPLLDQNKRIRGQLHGVVYESGHNSYTHIHYPCLINYASYGKFSNSWNGGGHNSDRLSNWLDPINTGQTTIDSYHPFIIEGSQHLFTQEVYQLNNLPSGWTVSWSFSSSYSYPSGLVQSNTPSANQCTLYNPNKAHVVGTLTATIYKSGGELYGSVSKNISTTSGFNGTYWQEDNFNVIPNNIPETSFSDGDIFIVGPKCDVYIKSYCFPGATITHTGANLNYWNYSLDGSYGVIHLRFPYKPYNQYLTIKVDDNSSISEFYLDAIVDPLSNFSPTLLASSDGQRLNIAMGVETEEYNTANNTQTNEAVRWDVVVCNAITGKVMYQDHVEGWSKVIDTTGWSAGIYIIKAQVGEHFVTQKIMIR